MKIIDAHFHLWNLDENYYPWLSDGDRPTLVKGFSALRRNYLVSDLLRDIGGLDVVAGVHIQAEHDPRDPVRETRWLQKVADDPASRGFPQGIVASADLADPGVERLLEAHCAFANTRGIRFAVHRRLGETPPYDPLLDPVWVGNFPLLRKYRLSFDLQLFSQQADAAVALIRGNPGVAFVLTHVGMPIRNDADSMAEWRTAIGKYAACPNVTVKISGFSGFDGFGPDWDERDLDPIVAHVIDAFTPRRCMLASNFPVDGLVKTYAEIWRIFAAYFARFSENEQESLFWRTAAEVYRLEV